MKRHWDVIVVGLGAMGSAAACHLAKQGVGVLGLDRFAPPHDRGSSHGRTRTIRFAYAEGAGYVPLVKRAHHLWLTLEAASGRRLLTTTGGLTIGDPQGPAVAGARRSVEKHAIAHEMLDAVAVRDRFPALVMTPGQVALFEPHTGVLNPEACIDAHLAAAKAHGATVLTGTPMRAFSVETPSSRVRVKTGTGDFTAARLVIAAGAWVPGLLPKAGAVLSPRRVYQFWFEAGGVDADRHPPRCPVHFWELPDGTELYGHPATHGAPGPKMAFHSIHAPADPDKPAGPPPAALTRRMTDFLRRHVPSLHGRPWISAPCLYTLSPDRHFVIGPLPERPEVIVSAGFSGHGFKFASVVGEAVAGLILGNAGTPDLTAFAPDRFTTKPHAQAIDRRRPMA